MHPSMGSSIALAAVAAALAVQSATSPPQSAPLKPSGPWNVEYADSMCILSRQFGTGEQSVILGFRPGLFSEHMRMVLVWKGNNGNVIWGDARISFDEGDPLKKPFSDHYVEKEHARVILIDLTVPDLAPLHSAKTVRIRAGKKEFLLAPDRASAAMAALDPCQKDLLVSWGMTPATIASIVTFPTVSGGLGSLFYHTDYPRSAIARNEQGTSGVRFWVGKNGKPRDCTVVESSGSPILDSQTCAVIMRRGRFEPARTASGDAVESISFQRVRWELPG